MLSDNMVDVFVELEFYVQHNTKVHLATVVGWPFGINFSIWEIKQKG